MFRLLVLGTTELQDSNAFPARSFLTGSKRLALLAYLALARPRGFHRRDKILGLLWPESDQQRARRSLRGLLYQVRRTLRPTMIVNRGESEIRIPDGELWCDALAFEKAVRSGRHRRAMELYRGEMLDGFHVAGAAADFQHWLEGERRHLRRLAAEAALTLADEQARTGSSTGAAYWGRRALGMIPYDEGAVRRLLEILDATDDCAGALEVYTDFALRLEAEWNAAPALETQALIEDIQERHRGRTGARRTRGAPRVPHGTDSIDGGERSMDSMHPTQEELAAVAGELAAWHVERFTDRAGRGVLRFSPPEGDAIHQPFEIRIPLRQDN